MTAQREAEEMARKMRALREREEAAGRWFEGRNGREVSAAEDGHHRARTARG